MKTARKLLCLLLVLSMVAAWLPAQVMATLVAHTQPAPVPQKIEKTRVVHFNPRYPKPDADIFAQCHKNAQKIAKERLGADCAALHNRQLRYQILLEENHKPLHHAIVFG